MTHINLTSYLKRSHQLATIGLKMATVAAGMILCSKPSHAQSGSDQSFNANHVKINVMALGVKNFSLQYERGLGSKTSVALGVRLQPKGALPFQSTFKRLMESSDDAAGENNAGADFANNAKMGNWAITPEFRYYLGKKPHSGFYFAPFIRIASYSLDWVYQYHESTGSSIDVDLKGKMTTFGGGLLLGTKWNLGKNITLDWWIIGPSISSAKVSLESNTDLSSLSQADRDELNQSLQDIKFPGGSITSEVRADGVTAKGNFVIPGLRTGICIGYTF